MYDLVFPKTKQSIEIKKNSSDDLLKNNISAKFKKKKPVKRESTVYSNVSVTRIKGKGGVMINNYIIEKNLGEGSFAQVKLCRDTNTGIKYALKLMNKKELKRKMNGNGTSAYDSVMEEIKVL